VGGPNGYVPYYCGYGWSSRYSRHVCLRVVILKANSLVRAVHVGP
jgi:hypothetical protein